MTEIIEIEGIKVVKNNEIIIVNLPGIDGKVNPISFETKSTKKATRRIKQYNSEIKQVDVAKKAIEDYRSAEKKTCPRCKGSGLTPHKNVYHGICFKCDGNGKVVK